MERRGRARAPAAGTILNALATGTGAAFAIDRHTEATVTLSDRPIDADGRSNDRSEPNGPTITGAVAGAPDADTRLIERCVSLVVEVFVDRDEAAKAEYGRVETESDVPMAAGLKSSSAAANATVLATLDALAVPITDGSSGDDGEAPTAERADPNDGETEVGTVTLDGAPIGADGGVSRVEACRLGVRAARDVGVTVTGAFDDASASMLGGVTITDNTADRLLAHDTSFERAVSVWTPPERAYSADANVERCRRIAPVAEVVANRALAGEYERAMTTNGFAFCGALGYSPEPMVEALAHVRGTSLSGTGPSVLAVGKRDAFEAVHETWNEREGNTWLTKTNSTGAEIV